MKFLVSLLLCSFFLLSCGETKSQPQTSPEKDTTAFHFNLPDKCEAVDSLSSPQAMLVKTDDGLLKLFVNKKNTQQSVSVSCGAVKNMKEIKMDTLQVNGTGLPEIRITITGIERVPFAQTTGYLEEKKTCVSIVDAEKAEIIFEAVPEYSYVQTGAYPIIEKSHYELEYSPGKIVVKNRRGNPGPNTPGKLVHNCYSFVKNKAVPCK